MINNDINIVILAGGIGKRLWPITRLKKPKQFVPLLSNRPLLRETYDRLAKRFPKKTISISTCEEFAGLMRDLFKETRLFIEPCPRDTASGMTFAACKLCQEAPDIPLLFIPADQAISNEELFLDCLEAAAELIRKTGKLIDIGIEPRFPAVTLGYTHIGPKVSECRGIEIFEFQGHTEKPNYEKAKQFLESGEYLWHANYYSWTPRLWIEAMRRYAPGILENVQKAIAASENGDQGLAKEIFSKIEPAMIDYAMMEKIDPENVLIVRGTFPWSDVGSWSEYYELKKDEYDEDLNLKEGKVISLETSGSLIKNKTKRLVAAFGLENIVIIDTEDALLVCPRSKASDLKKLLNELSKKHSDLL